jgi:hypothetical protein
MEFCAKVDSPDYTKLVKEKFGIEIDVLESANHSDVAAIIDREHPALVMMLASCTPWTGRTRENDGQHVFLIVGYDKTAATFTCIDPYFMDQPQTLAFDAIDNNKTKVYDYSFDNYRVDEEQHLASAIASLIAEVKSAPVSAVLREMYAVQSKNIDVLLGSLGSDVNTDRLQNRVSWNPNDAHDVFKYIIAGGDMLALSGRFGRLRGLYLYLHEKYKYDWLLEISELYKTCYDNTRALLMLMLKYDQTGDKSILDRYLAKSYDFPTMEEKTEKILLSNVIGLFGK